MNPIVTRIRGSLTEDVKPQPLAVIRKDKVIKNGTMVCPHCTEEIHEKGTFARMEEGGSKLHIFHGACGGELIMPPPSAAEQKFLDQLRSYVSENTVNPTPEGEDAPPAKPDITQQLATSLKRILETDRVERVVIQTHYGNHQLQPMEWWVADGVLNISVQAEAPQA